MGYNFAAEVDKIAQAAPDRKAVVCLDEDGQEQILTYGDLRLASNRLARRFLEAGINRGSRVVVLLTREIEPYIVYLSLMKAGATIMPGSEMLRAKDIRYRIAHAKADAVVAHPTLVGQVDEIRSECPSVKNFYTVGAEIEGYVTLENLMNDSSDEDIDIQTEDDDIGFLSYTSGTTGGPKGVLHSYRWAGEHLAVAGTFWFDALPGEMCWATAGPGWGKWIWSPFVSILGKGGTSFVYHGRFKPEKYLQIMEDYKISLFCSTPTEYRLMAKVRGLDRYRLSLRSAVSAGEPLNREVIDTFQRQFGVAVRDGYGQTETSLMVGTLQGMEVRPGSMGKPVPGTPVSIVDDEGNEVPPGEVGHIAVQKTYPALFKGYLNDSDRTAKAFRGDWYVTGDRGRKDEDGYFWFEGRADDIIISSGYTIGPFEVEDALVKHPKVAECAVVASPDLERGHIVKAFVILRHPEDRQDRNLVKELQDYVKLHTAPYKYPRAIQFVDALPKTTSGKIRRIELRQQEEASAAQLK